MTARTRASHAGNNVQHVIIKPECVQAVTLERHITQDQMFVLVRQANTD